MEPLLRTPVQNTFSQVRQKQTQLSEKVDDRWIESVAYPFVWEFIREETACLDLLDFALTRLMVHRIHQGRQASRKDFLRELWTLMSQPQSDFYLTSTMLLKSGFHHKHLSLQAHGVWYLRLKQHLSLGDIGAILSISRDQVERRLEEVFLRISIDTNKKWLSHRPVRLPTCPDTQDGVLFLKYSFHLLTPTLEKALHNHMSVCALCLGVYQRFRDSLEQWHQEMSAEILEPSVERSQRWKQVFEDWGPSVNQGSGRRVKLAPQGSTFLKLFRGIAHQMLLSVTITSGSSTQGMPLLPAFLFFLALLGWLWLR